MHFANRLTQSSKLVNDSCVEKADALSKFLTPLDGNMSEQIKGGYWNAYSYAAPAYSTYVSHQVAANHLDTLLLA
jgi:hypothetical protein